MNKRVDEEEAQQSPLGRAVCFTWYLHISKLLDSKTETWSQERAARVRLFRVQMTSRDGGMVVSKAFAL